MSRILLHETVGRLRRLTQPPAADDDAELLRRFARERDEAAFAELVQRHGALVLGVARRVVGEHHAAEDVVQATFLLLARKASHVGWRSSIAPWLHAAAFRLACEARRKHARVPQPLPDPPCPAADAGLERPLLWAEAREAIDEELSRLSAPLRAPLVLCYLQGLTRDEAALRLGWSLATLKRRLERARNLLRDRLTRRGLALTAALAALTHDDRLPAATIEPIARLAAGAPAPAAVAALLANGGAARRLLLLLVMFSAAAGGLTFAVQSDQPDPPPAKRDRAEAPLPIVRDDAPLPAGAVARLGSALLGPGLNIQAVEFSPDGKQMAIDALRWGHDNKNRLIIADTATGRELRRVDLQGQILHLKWLKDGRGLAVVKRTAKDFYLWEWTDEKAEVPRRDRFDPTNFPTDPKAVAFSPDGRWLAVARDGGFDPAPLQLFEAAPNAPLDKLKSRELARGVGRVAMAYSPDSRRLFVVRREWEPGARNGVMGSGPQGTIGLARRTRLSVFEVGSGNRLTEMDVATPLMDTAGVNAPRLAVSPDGKTLYLGDDEGYVHAYDWATRLPTMEFAAHTAVDQKNGDRPGVRSLSLSPDGRTLYTAGPGGASAWTLPGRKPRRTEFTWPSRTELVAASTDGRSIAVAGSGTTGRLTLLDAATGNDLLPRAGHTGVISSVAVAPDGKVITAGLDHTVRWWDLNAGRELRRLPLPEAVAVGPKLTADGRGLFFNDGRNNITYLDLASGERKKVAEDVKPLAFFKLIGNSTIVHLTNDGKGRLWDAAAGKEPPLTLPKRPANEQAGTGPSAIAPDGRRMVALGQAWTRSGNYGYFDGSQIEFYDATNGALLRRWRTNEIQTTQAAWSPDGRHVLVAGSGTLGNTGSKETDDLLPIPAKSGLLLFDGLTGEPIRPVEPASRLEPSPRGERMAHAVTALAYSPDGLCFAVAQMDGAVHVHESATGNPCRSYAGHRNQVDGLAFTSDGKRLVSVSHDMTGLVWDTSLAALSKPRELKSGADRDRAWADLAKPEWELAGPALAGLASRPSELLKLVRARLPAADRPDLDPETLAKLVAQLDDPTFAVRERAGAALARSGREALPLLQDHLARATTTEARNRLRQLLRDIAARPVPSGHLRQTRVLAALEQAGTPEAVAELKGLAAGHAEAALTRDAAAALRRVTAK